MSNEIKPLSEMTTGDKIGILIFFLVHTTGFAALTFATTYNDGVGLDAFAGSLTFGGFAIYIYMTFYIRMFSKETLKGLFLGIGFGLLQTYAWLGLIVPLFMSYRYYETFNDIPLYLHIIPGIFFIMLTFLFKNFLVVLFNDHKGKWLIWFNIFLFLFPIYAQYNNITFQNKTNIHIKNETNKTIDLEQLNQADINREAIIKASVNTNTGTGNGNIEYTDKMLKTTLDEFVSKYSTGEIEAMRIKYKDEIEAYEKSIIERSKVEKQ